MSDTAVTTGSVQVKVDSDRINAFFNDLNLNNNERKKAVKAALRKSASIIRKQTQSNLVAVVPNANHKSIKKGVEYKPLKNEVHLAVYRNASGVRVDLLDKRRKGSRAYMLKFFENGTKERTKGHNRGSIKATNFFNNAVNSKKAEAEKSLEQNIIDMIKKAASKK